MASEKAKDNKTLVARCQACGKIVSVELMHGLVVRRGARQTTVAVCDQCRDAGWQPAAS